MWLLALFIYILLASSAVGDVYPSYKLFESGTGWCSNPSLPEKPMLLKEGENVIWTALYESEDESPVIYAILQKTPNSSGPGLVRYESDSDNHFVFIADLSSFTFPHPDAIWLDVPTNAVFAVVHDGGLSTKRRTVSMIRALGSVVLDELIAVDVITGSFERFHPPFDGRVDALWRDNRLCARVTPRHDSSGLVSNVLAIEPDWPTPSISSSRNRVAVEARRQKMAVRAEMQHVPVPSAVANLAVGVSHRVLFQADGVPHTWDETELLRRVVVRSYRMQDTRAHDVYQHVEGPLRPKDGVQVGHVIREKNGTLAAVWSSTAVGEYVLRVAVDGIERAGEIWHVRVTAGPVDPAMTLYNGVSRFSAVFAHERIPAGFNFSFILSPHDRFGNYQASMSFASLFSVCFTSRRQAHRGPQETVCANVEADACPLHAAERPQEKVQDSSARRVSTALTGCRDFGPGHRVTSSLAKAGPYEVTVAYNGRWMGSGSITVLPGRPDADATLVSGTNLEFGLAGQEYDLFITPYDRYGNPCILREPVPFSILLVEPLTVHPPPKYTQVDEAGLSWSSPTDAPANPSATPDTAASRGGGASKYFANPDSEWWSRCRVLATSAVRPARSPTATSAGGLAVFGQTAAAGGLASNSGQSYGDSGTGVVYRATYKFTKSGLYHIVVQLTETTDDGEEGTFLSANITHTSFPEPVLPSSFSPQYGPLGGGVEITLRLPSTPLSYDMAAFFRRYEGLSVGAVVCVFAGVAVDGAWSQRAADGTGAATADPAGIVTCNSPAITDSLLNTTGYGGHARSNRDTLLPELLGMDVCVMPAGLLDTMWDPDLFSGCIGAEWVSIDDTCPQRFHVYEIPHVQAVLPDHAHVGSPVEVMVVGSGFIDTSQIACRIGGPSPKVVPAQFVSTSQLRCVITGHVPATCPLEVSLNGVTFGDPAQPARPRVYSRQDRKRRLTKPPSGAGLDDVFITFYGAPKVESVWPVSGDVTGGSRVCIHLDASVTFFSSSATCFFGTEEVEARVLSGNTIECVSPHAALILPSARRTTEKEWVAFEENLERHAWHKDSAEHSKIWRYRTEPEVLEAETTAIVWRDFGIIGSLQRAIRWLFWETDIDVDDAVHENDYNPADSYIDDLDVPPVAGTGAIGDTSFGSGWSGVVEATAGSSVVVPPRQPSDWSDTTHTTHSSVTLDRDHHHTADGSEPAPDEIFRYAGGGVVRVSSVPLTVRLGHHDLITEFHYYNFSLRSTDMSAGLYFDGGIVEFFPNVDAGEFFPYHEEVCSVVCFFEGRHHAAETDGRVREGSVQCDVPVWPHTDQVLVSIALNGVQFVEGAQHSFLPAVRRVTPRHLPTKGGTDVYLFGDGFCHDNGSGGCEPDPPVTITSLDGEATKVSSNVPERRSMAPPSARAKYGFGGGTSMSENLVDTVLCKWLSMEGDVLTSSGRLLNASVVACSSPVFPRPGIYTLRFALSGGGGEVWVDRALSLSPQGARGAGESDGATDNTGAGTVSAMEFSVYEPPEIVSVAPVVLEVSTLASYDSAIRLTVAASSSVWANVHEPDSGRKSASSTWYYDRWSATSSPSGPMPSSFATGATTLPQTGLCRLRRTDGELYFLRAERRGSSHVFCSISHAASLPLPGDYIVGLALSGMEFVEAAAVLNLYDGSVAPVVESVHPSSLPVDSEVDLVLIGSNFANEASAACRFGESAVSQATFLSSTSVRCKFHAVRGVRSGVVSVAVANFASSSMSESPLSPWRDKWTSVPAAVVVSESHAAKTEAWGPGLCGPAVAGQPLSFLIMPRNAAGLPVFTGHDRIVVTLLAADPHATDPRVGSKMCPPGEMTSLLKRAPDTVSATKDSLCSPLDYIVKWDEKLGMFEVTATATIAGEYRFAVLLGGVHIAGSPGAGHSEQQVLSHGLSIRVHPASLSISDTVCVFPSHVQAGQEASFEIHPQDQYGNSVALEGRSLSLEFWHASADTVGSNDRSHVRPTSQYQGKGSARTRVPTKGDASSFFSVLFVDHAKEAGEPVVEDDETTKASSSSRNGETTGWLWATRVGKYEVEVRLAGIPVVDLSVGTGPAASTSPGARPTVESSRASTHFARPVVSVLPSAIHPPATDVIVSSVFDVSPSSDGCLSVTESTRGRGADPLWRGPGVRQRRKFRVDAALHASGSLTPVEAALQGCVLAMMAGEVGLLVVRTADVYDNWLDSGGSTVVPRMIRLSDEIPDAVWSEVARKPAFWAEERHVHASRVAAWGAEWGARHVIHTLEHPTAHVRHQHAHPSSSDWSGMGNGGPTLWVRDDLDGTYVVRWHVAVTGLYQLFIDVDGVAEAAHVMIAVLPSPVSAAASSHRLENSFAVQAGFVSNFSVTLRDPYLNAVTGMWQAIERVLDQDDSRSSTFPLLGRDLPSDDVRVRFLSPFGADVWDEYHGGQALTQGGDLVFHYRPTVAGLYRLEVSIVQRASDVAGWGDSGSSMSSHNHAHHAEASASTPTYPSHAGLDTLVDDAMLCTTMAGVLVGATGTGSVTVDELLSQCMQDPSLQLEHIASSPSFVRVVPGPTDPAKCIVGGSAISNSLEAGDVGYLQIQAFDQFENSQDYSTRSVDPFVVVAVIEGDAPLGGYWESVAEEAKPTIPPQQNNMFETDSGSGVAQDGAGRTSESETEPEAQRGPWSVCVIGDTMGASPADVLPWAGVGGLGSVSTGHRNESEDGGHSGVNIPQLPEAACTQAEAALGPISFPAPPHRHGSVHDIEVIVYPATAVLFHIFLGGDPVSNSPYRTERKQRHAPQTLVVEFDATYARVELTYSDPTNRGGMGNAQFLCADLFEDVTLFGTSLVGARCVWDSPWQLSVDLDTIVGGRMTLNDRMVHKPNLIYNMYENSLPADGETSPLQPSTHPSVLGPHVLGPRVISNGGAACPTPSSVLRSATVEGASEYGIGTSKIDMNTPHSQSTPGVSSLTPTRGAATVGGAAESVGEAGQDMHQATTNEPSSWGMDAGDASRMEDGIEGADEVIMLVGYLSGHVGPSAGVVLTWRCIPAIAGVCGTGEEGEVFLSGPLLRIPPERLEANTPYHISFAAVATHGEFGWPSEDGQLWGNGFVSSNMTSSWVDWPTAEVGWVGVPWLALVGDSRVEELVVRKVSYDVPCVIAPHIRAAPGETVNVWVHVAPFYELFNGLKPTLMYYWVFSGIRLPPQLTWQPSLGVTSEPWAAGRGEEHFVTVYVVAVWADKSIERGDRPQWDLLPTGILKPTGQGIGRSGEGSTRLHIPNGFQQHQSQCEPGQDANHRGQRVTWNCVHVSITVEDADSNLEDAGRDEKFSYFSSDATQTTTTTTTQTTTDLSPHDSALASKDHRHGSSSRHSHIHHHHTHSHSHSQEAPPRPPRGKQIESHFFANEDSIATQQGVDQTSRESFAAEPKSPVTPTVIPNPHKSVPSKRRSLL
eukprot:Rmarinus@m.27342